MSLQRDDVTPAKQPKTEGNKKLQDGTTTNISPASKGTKDSQEELSTETSDTPTNTQPCDTEGGVDEGQRSSEETRKRQRDSDEGTCYNGYEIAVSYEPGRVHI